SAAASAAYLTVSEVFPLEIRALAIAVFFAAGTLLGGVIAPFLFGWLIENGARQYIVAGYLFAALLMVGASIVELFIGVAAARGQTTGTCWRPKGHSPSCARVSGKMPAAICRAPPMASASASARSMSPCCRPAMFSAVLRSCSTIAAAASSSPATTSGALM